MEEDIDLRAYLNVILKRWYIVLMVVLVSITYVYLPTLSQKKVYEAQASLLIKEGEGGIVQNQIAGMLLGMKVSTGSGSNSTFTVLLSSRAVAEKVMDDLGLVKRIKGWDQPGVKKRDLVTAVQGMPVFATEKGMLGIKVRSEDPILSADLANAFARAASDYWNRMNYTEARKKREYIESQLPRVERDLKKATNALKNFSLIAADSTSLQGVEYKALERECQIQGDTYTLLRKEYEMVKLEESKELNPYTMVDPAEPPTSPLELKAHLKLLIGAVLGLFIGTILAFGVEFVTAKK